MVRLDELPVEIIEIVLSLLSLSDIAQFERTCFSLRFVANEFVRRRYTAVCEKKLGSRWSVGALTWIAKRCPRVRSIDLSRVATDELLFVTARHFGELEQLALTSSEEVTDGGVRMVLLLCPHLRIVDATFCRNVTDTSVDLVRKHCPQVLLRRIPKCFARSWSSIQHSGIPNGEVHRYFEDGRFQFSRDMEAHGHVWTFLPARDGKPWFELHVNYTDIGDFMRQHQFPPGFVWRPGVCVRMLPDNRMQTAQSKIDLTCPDHIPSQDTDTIAVGFWKAIDD